MIATFQGIRMCKAKVLIEYYSPTTLFTDVLISVFCLHVFPGKYALLKLKVYTILTQNLWEQVTFDLLYVVKYSISKNEVALVCRMGMQIEIHK